MILQENYMLHNGVAIPKVALGTWQVSNEDVVNSVKTALSLGYRHIDTAAAYQNEQGVGRALKESGIARESVFLTTKIPAEVKSYAEAKAVIEASLSNLGTDSIDLMLIHSPKPWPELFMGSEKTYFEENLSVWKAMEEAYTAGKLRAIGVSNFEISDIENIIKHASIKPHANQIRVHIGHAPKENIAYCQRNEIVVMAFSPNATGHLSGNETIESVAKKYGVSVSQLGSRYDLQLGVLPLPRSTKADHIQQNSHLDFVISDEDMEVLAQVPEISSL